MFTRCPECQSLYRLTPEQLRVARGKVRCGKCTNVFDALDELVEQSDAEQTSAAESGQQAAQDEDPAAGSASHDAEQAPGPEDFSDTRLLDEELLEASGILEAPEFAAEPEDEEESGRSETEQPQSEQPVVAAADSNSDANTATAQAQTDDEPTTAGPLGTIATGQDPWRGLYFDDEHGIPDGGTEPGPAPGIARIETAGEDHTATHWNMEPLSSEYNGDDGGDGGDGEAFIDMRPADNEASPEEPPGSDDAEVATPTDPAEHQPETEHTVTGSEPESGPRTGQQHNSIDHAPAATGPEEEHSASRTFLQRIWGGRKNKDVTAVSPAIAAVFEPAAATNTDTEETDAIWGEGESNVEAPAKEQIAAVSGAEDGEEPRRPVDTTDQTETGAVEERLAQHGTAADGSGGPDGADAAHDGAADSGEDAQQPPDDGRAPAMAEAGNDRDDFAPLENSLDDEIDAALNALDDEPQAEAIEDAETGAADAIAAAGHDDDNATADDTELDAVLSAAADADSRDEVEAVLDALEDAPQEAGELRSEIDGETGAGHEAEAIEDAETGAADAIATAGHDDDNATADDADLDAVLSAADDTDTHDEVEAVLDALEDAPEEPGEDEWHARSLAGATAHRDSSAAVEIDLDEELDATVGALSDESHDGEALDDPDQAESDTHGPREDDDDFAGVFEGLDAVDWDDDGSVEEPVAAAPEPDAKRAANESDPVEQSLLDDILSENEQKSAPVEVVAATSGIHLQLPEESDLADVDEEAWENLSAQLGLGPDSNTDSDGPAAADAKPRNDDPDESVQSGAGDARRDDPTDLLYETFVSSTITPADLPADAGSAAAVEPDAADQPDTRHSTTAASAAPFPGSPPPRGRRLLLAAGSFALALLLAVQLIHARRDELLVDSAFAPTLRGVYQTFGYPLPENWDLSAYDLRQMSAVINPDSPNVIRIKVSLRNRAARAQPYPVVRLILIDIWGEPIGQRDLLPAQYLSSDPPPLMAAGENVTGEIAVVEPTDQKAENFEIDACLTLEAGVLECANPR